MSARHKRHRRQRALSGISSTIPRQKIAIGKMQIAGGLSLEISLSDHGQGPRIVIAKLGKAGRTVGSLSIEADNGQRFGGCFGRWNKSAIHVDFIKIVVSL